MEKEREERRGRKKEVVVYSAQRETRNDDGFRRQGDENLRRDIVATARASLRLRRGRRWMTKDAFQNAETE